MSNLSTFLTSLTNKNRRIHLFWTDLTQINVLEIVSPFKWCDSINFLSLGFE